MTEKKIVFFDSGIGGIPYLRHIEDKLEGFKAVYLADNGYFPYGERDKKELIRHVTALASALYERFQPVLLVIACNTASVTSLESVRAVLPIPVVGVVPALKPAALGTRGAITILATENTIKTPYLQDLIDSFAPDHDVHRVIAGDLVRFVEERLALAGEREKRELITRYAGIIEQNGTSSLVLGCTHYTHLDDYFRNMLPGDVDIIDSREGVGKRILDLLGISSPTVKYTIPVDFFCTDEGRVSENYRAVCRQYHYIFKGDFRA